MTTESYKEDGRPAQQWYWDDWFSAFDVRLCSLAARGLWIDMLGIMWKAEIRGTLTINGVQVNSKILAKITNSTAKEINKLLKELEDNNVFSCLEDETIICRRVFRESGKKDKISQIRSEVGKRGAEKRWYTDESESDRKNGKNNKRGLIFNESEDGKSMVKIADPPSRGGLVVNKSEDGKKMAKMASSSSTPTSTPTSSSSSILNDNKVAKTPFWLPKEEFEEFKKMRKKMRKPMTEKAEELLIRKLEKLKEEGHDPKEVIEQSIASSWLGFFPLRESLEKTKEFKGTAWKE